MTRLMHRGHLKDYERFGACASFVQNAVLELARAKPSHEWRQYGTYFSILGDGTLWHPVYVAEEFGGISPIIQMVSPVLYRAAMITLTDNSEIQVADLDREGPVLEAKIQDDPWETPWTKGDVHMLKVHMALFDKSWEALLRILTVWMHNTGDLPSVQREVYRLAGYRNTDQ